MTDHLPTITVHGPEGAHALREPLLAIRAEVKGPLSANGDGAWLTRAATHPGFRLVTVHVDAELVGYAFGYTLKRSSRFWDGLLTPPEDPGLLVEDGRRTFVGGDMMVLPHHRGRGYSHLLHDTMAHSRPEQRAALVVDPDIAQHAAYRAWGWTTLGEYRFTPDSPTYLAMLHDLPLTPARPRSRPPGRRIGEPATNTT
ncbi:hypothetical protein ACQPZF_19780 [Actinosynnema sp. CS-041913]|uniref:hypothetical protein n=1 Tax=Actinosynnema sp. CS-041913 TaxID=3239917 RepID=UPI003D8D06D9